MMRVTEKVGEGGAIDAGDAINYSLHKTWSKTLHVEDEEKVGAQNFFMSHYDGKKSFSIKRKKIF